MTTTAKKTGGSSKYDLGPLPPSGMHQAVCVDVVDLGRVTQTYEGRTRDVDMILMIWQLALRDPQTRKRYLIGKRYNLSLHEKATLRKDLESWRTRAFTPAEEDGFETKKCIGANCQVVVKQVVKTTGTYANVEVVAPKAVNLPPLVAEDYKPALPVEEADYDDSVDPFEGGPYTPAAPPVGTPAAPAPVTADDIPF